MNDYEQTYHEAMESYQQTITDLRFEVKKYRIVLGMMAFVTALLFVLTVMSGKLIDDQRREYEKKQAEWASEKKALETNIAVCEQKVHDRTVQRDVCEDLYNASFKIWIEKYPP